MYIALGLAITLALPGPAALAGAGQVIAPPLCPRSPATTSRECLACHDGVAASAAESGPARLRTGGDPRDHPVRVSYAAAWRRAPRDYVPPFRLDPSVRLPDGQVQCVTCHEPVPAAAGHTRTLRCQACHRL